MGVCVPKHVVCDWFVPSFVEGPTCVLQLFNETKSRLEAGGTLFRSINVGASENNITIKAVWQEFVGGVWVDTTTINDTERVQLTVSKNATNEVFNATQTYNTLSSAWVGGAIASLRSSINATSTLIHMPPVDTPTGYGTTILDPDGLSSFPETNMSGGESGPLDPVSAGVRTGPTTSMIFIRDSEKEQDHTGDGVLDNIRQTRYWNGFCWKEYTPNTDCYDPNTPPGDCVLGPSSEC